jgi:succinyl-diaminopimelate desuccinylase
MTLSPAVALLRDLIRCPSVTPQEGGALALLETRLQAAGFATHRLTFSQAGTPDVENLYARIGTQGPCLAFAGHTDVVPPGDASAWRHDPFASAIEDGMIFGRGACDMKGGVAAFVAATLAFLEKNGPPKGSIAFLLTGDEEGPAVNGTVKLLDWARERGERLDHCLLGEPTNPTALGDMMKIGRRGSLTGTVTVKGVQGHVAYPHLADNPIPRLVAILTALKATPLDSGTAHFDASNLEATSFDVGNPASNVIPAQAKATFNIRFNDLWTPDTLAQEIRRRCESVAPGGFDLSFAPTNALAFLTRPGRFSELVAGAIEAETGRVPKLSTTGGTSDARFIVRDCEVIEFGLAGQTMHMVDERVAVADVEALARIYERVLERYFA